MTTGESSRPDEYYEQLLPLTATVESVREALESEQALTTEQQVTAQRLLFVSLRPIKEARRILPEPESKIDTQYIRTADPWDEYEDALVHIERRLDQLLQYSYHGHSGSYPSSNSPKAKFQTALKGIMALRESLPLVLPEGSISVDIPDHRPDVDTVAVDGRGHGDGRWLEYQLQRALTRWGYQAETRQTLFGLEVDVVARRKSKQGEPTDWIVGQCKDWTSDPVTPATLFRLCTVAFACRAMPVLCHTTEMTSRTEDLARQFEVRVLELKDLDRGELPAPHVAKPTTELQEWGAQYRARDDRGTFPLMFRGEPGKHFSYVPGFAPVGRDADYEPIENERDDDSHPAAGH